MRQELHSAGKRYAASEERFIKLPATFLGPKDPGGTSHINKIASRAPVDEISRAIREECMTGTSSVREYLDSKGFTYGSRSEAALDCPFCEDHEMKFSINLDSGTWKCFHENRCGRSGNLWQLQKALGDEPEKKDYSPACEELS